jgi:hypothetical protein
MPTQVRETPPFFSTFPMFVPSLSWQNDGAYIYIKSNEVGFSCPGKKTPFLRHLILQTIISPRQARDKHRETQKKSDIFLTGPNSHGYNTQLMPIICAKANATGYFLPADWPVVAAR